MSDRPRYTAVQMDKRTGAHQILALSEGYDTCIAAFQGFGPCPCGSPIERIKFITHLGDGESWWDLAAQADKGEQP